MKKIFLALSLCLFAFTIKAQTFDIAYYKLVNPFVGTDFHGHTYPGAVAPFGMVQLSPDTRLDGWDGCSAYHYSDDVIHGFSHTHLSGTGCSDYGDFLFTPTMKNAESKEFILNFSHKDEYAHAGYYKVKAYNEDTIITELTSTERVGYHKYSFPTNSKEKIVIIDFKHRDQLLDMSFDVLDNNTVVGYRRSSAWNTDQRVYFAAKFSSPIQKHEFDKERKKLFLYFGTSNQENNVLEAKVAISSVDENGAMKNLTADKFEKFEDAKHYSEQLWNKELGKIEVESKDKEKLITFYTCLYHCMIAPNLYSDVDGRYRGMDNKIYTTNNYNRYTVFSLWDTYRTLHPLLALIDRERSLDFAKTSLDIYSQSGFLPMWELASFETYCMIGMHGISMMADLYTKGIIHDKDLTLQSMLGSMEKKKFGFDHFLENGFISSEKEHESVSKTVEYAYNMYCVAKIAKMQNKQDIYKSMIEKAQYYKNLFNPNNTFIQPKENGRFMLDFNPTQIDQNYTEGNGWHYTFYAPGDVNGLIEIMGGDKEFCRKLDSCFFTNEKTTGRNQADVTGLIGQYCHGNEPSQHTAYLYAYSGQAYKTQQLVRQILTTLYSPKPDGICGNDDVGQMSAWYVMSAMGFYPVCPVDNQYVVASPLFEKITIHLENGKNFVIEAPNAEKTPYVKEIKLNGKDYNKSFINYDDIKNGGKLQFTMSDKAVKDFATAKEDRPYSKIESEDFCVTPFVSYQGTGTFTKNIEVYFKAFNPQDTIFVSLSNGKNYRFVGNGKIKVKESVIISAFSQNKTKSKSVETKLYKIPAGRSVKVLTNANSQYTASGDFALIDLKRGNDNWKLGCWQGYWGEDLEAVIDLGKKQEVKKIGGNFIQDQKSWIFMPTKVEYYISNDGIDFQLLEIVENDVPQKQEGAVIKTFFTNKEFTARYIKIKAYNLGINPEWHLSAGEKAWLFIDEVIIEQ
ncbi:MAG: GH92 family glycosyl hydrolase [Bacteroidales bacterium]|nr:GH92 family glycosyl hydrolase [Bacteroidales bacterium]